MSAIKPGMLCVVVGDGHYPAEHPMRGRVVEAHSSRDLAKAQRDRIADPIFDCVVRRCSVGEVV